MTTSTVDPTAAEPRVPGVAASRWVYPSVRSDVAAHRLHGPFHQAREEDAALIARARRHGMRLALCGLAARGWQDVATCPPGAAPFPPCEACERALRGRAETAETARAETPAVEPPAAPWRAAGFAARPTTGAGAR